MIPTIHIVPDNYAFRHQNLLPEFRGGINLDECSVRAVRHRRSIPHADVLGSGEVHCAVLGVPVVVTRLPGQHLGERREQVVERPGQDHVVVTVHHEYDGGRRPTNTWQAHGHIL